MVIWACKMNEKLKCAVIPGHRGGDEAKRDCGVWSNGGQKMRERERERERRIHIEKIYPCLSSHILFSFHFFKRGERDVFEFRIHRHTPTPLSAQAQRHYLQYVTRPEASPPTVPTSHMVHSSPSAAGTKLALQKLHTRLLLPR